MKSKTIKRYLSENFNYFVDSITDEDVRKLVRKNSIITGGSIVSLLLNEKVNDYDIYFTNKETTKKVAEYFVKQFNNINNACYQEYSGLYSDGSIKYPVASRNFVVGMEYSF